MRVGLFSDTYPPDINGVAISVLTLQQELVKNGHEVFVITTHPSLFHTQKDGNILRLPGIELKKLYGYVMSNPLQIFAINDILKMKLDIIHVHTEFGIGIYARMISHFLHIPIIGTYHTTYEEYTHYVTPKSFPAIGTLAKKTVAKLSKKAGDTCLEMIAPSEKTKELLEKYRINKPISVIPTGIDLLRFDHTQSTEKEKERLKEKYNLQDKFIVLFVGRIATEKSVDMVINALLDIKKEIKNIHFLVVGSGPQLDDYVQLAKSKKLSSLVSFVGMVDSNEVPKYYHIADAFISASTTETQGLTYIEALASSLVVFAKDRLVAKNVVVEGKTGYFFDDEKELARKVSKYYKLNEQQKQEMQENAKNQVKIYGSEFFYQEVFKIYERVVKGYKDLYVINDLEYVKECVRLHLSNQAEKFKLLVSIDTYYDLGIRKKQVLTNELVETLKVEEQKVKAYYRCLNRLRFKDRTVKEIYDFITDNFTLPIKEVNEIVETLIQQHYIDDRRYAAEYINAKSSLMLGNNKIIFNLKRKGINVDLIRELLEDSNDDEKETALNYAIKIMPGIKGRSLKEKQLMIQRRLLSRGFSYEICELTIGKLNFSDDRKNELGNLEKAAEKAKRRYEIKHKNSALRNQVFRYLVSKSYRIEDIYVILDTMRWEDEN